MTVHWDSLLAVFLVSLGSAVAVVVLVALALLGLSARAAVVDGPAPPTALGRGGHGGGRGLPGRRGTCRPVRALGHHRW